MSLSLMHLNWNLRCWVPPSAPAAGTTSVLGAWRSLDALVHNKGGISLAVVVLGVRDFEVRNDGVDNHVA